MTTATDMAPAYVDVRGAATILGIAPQTLRNWATLQTGPALFRFGRAARYSVSELHEWAAAQKVLVA